MKVGVICRREYSTPSPKGGKGFGSCWCCRSWPRQYRFPGNLHVLDTDPIVALWQRWSNLLHERRFKQTFDAYRLWAAQSRHRPCRNLSIMTKLILSNGEPEARDLPLPFKGRGIPNPGDVPTLIPAKHRSIERSGRCGGGFARQ